MAGRTSARPSSDNSTCIRPVSLQELPRCDALAVQKSLPGSLFGGSVASLQSIRCTWEALLDRHSLLCNIYWHDAPGGAVHLGIYHGKKQRLNKTTEKFDEIFVVFCVEEIRPAAADHLVGGDAELLHPQADATQPAP